MKKLIPCIALLLALLLCACAAQTPAPAASAEPEAAATGPVSATITMEDGGVIKLELYPDIAPQSVYNFCALAREGFYDGLTFHRIVNGFMIQGGDPKGTGTGGPGYSIKGEFGANGVSNPLSHERGVISMARSASMDSAGSQFFIVHQDSKFLDGQYAAFGRVTEGMDVVDEIARVRTLDGEKPYRRIVIKSITIDGPELPAPEKLPEA